MRVTTQMAYSSVAKNINKNYNNMMKRQKQCYSESKYESPSDDPYAANTAMYLKSELKGIQQHIENADMANNLLADTEAAITDIDESIQRVNELLVRAKTTTMGIEERTANAEELQQIKEHIVSVLNSTSAGRYIFGGYNTTQPPIEVNGATTTYNGIDLATLTQPQYNASKAEAININIATGVSIQPTTTALEIISSGVGDDNLLQTIDQAIDILKTEPFDDVAMATQQENMDTHFQRVLYRLSEIGGKQKRLDMVQARSEKREIDVKDLISQTEGIDIEEAIMQYKMAEQAYLATLASSSKIVQPSLLDYLR